MRHRAAVLARKMRSELRPDCLLISEAVHTGILGSRHDAYRKRERHRSRGAAEFTPYVVLAEHARPL
jgi:hypothetical protein